MAALMCLPYAFASHFAPKALDEAIALYRKEFRPSEYLDKLYDMLGYNVFAAHTDAEARFLASSMQHSVASLRIGDPQTLQPPLEGYYDGLPLAPQPTMDKELRASALVGMDEVPRD